MTDELRSAQAAVFSHEATKHLKWAIGETETGLELMVFSEGVTHSIDAPWPFLVALAGLDRGMVVVMHDEIKRVVSSRT